MNSYVSGSLEPGSIPLENDQKPSQVLNYHHDHHSKGPLSLLVLGAIGVVYGDIGTSPLYTIKTIFGSDSLIALNDHNVLGILSAIFWSLIVVVTVKYVAIIMNADNRGQGGVLALSTLASRAVHGRWVAIVTVLGMLGMALFSGDSLITPAISVLSAVEGLKIVAPNLGHWIVPLSIVVIIGLFLIQSRGTESVGKLFGPIMVFWFLALGAMGSVQIIQHPHVLYALSPHWAGLFFFNHGMASFFVLGGVVLAVTGGEALYADMGHFGPLPIRLAWIIFVLPCLVINYFGQGALILDQPSAIENPFYLLAPDWAQWPLVIISTLATVIASQAVISGAFSLIQSGVQLGYLPRREVRHTSSKVIGQIYIPRSNWLLMVGVIILVLGFRTSDNLAAAYGIAVMGTMTISAILAWIVANKLWRWNAWLTTPLFTLLLFVDFAFLSACSTKILDGGWFPVLVAALSFTSMVVWRKGRRVLAKALYSDAMPIKNFIESQKGLITNRTPGTAVFLTGNPTVVPISLLHNLKHNKILHERVVIMRITSADVPWRRPENRCTVDDLGHGFWIVTIDFGYMERPDVPAALPYLKDKGLEIDMMKTSFFVGRETLVPSRTEGQMSSWEEQVFIALSKTAGSATDFFALPPNLVVELGSRVLI